MAPDYKMYNHFLARLEEEVQEFGAGRMAEELGELQRANTEVTERCAFTQADNKDLAQEHKMWGFANMVGYQVMVYLNIFDIVLIFF